MLLIVALLLYLLVVILTFSIAYSSGIRKWSALVLGLIVGWILLNLFCSPQKILTEFDGSFLPLLYIIIELGTLIVILFYCIIMVMNDTCICNHIDKQHLKTADLEVDLLDI
jgi:hypothetical protein